jgi:hypothetical protein
MRPVRHLPLFDMLLVPFVQSAFHESCCIDMAIDRINEV